MRSANTEIDLRFFSTIIGGRMKAEEKSGRSLGPEIGLGSATLSRLINGDAPDLRTYILVCRWLGVSLDTFVLDQMTDELGDS